MIDCLATVENCEFWQNVYSCNTTKKYVQKRTMENGLLALLGTQHARKTYNLGRLVSAVKKINMKERPFNATFWKSTSSSICARYM